MAAEYQYFYEDEVYRINKRGNVEFGMVLENAELVSGDENSDVEEGGRMKKGHIRVAWHPKGVEEVIPERKVGLADRSLMPGDVVRRMIKGKDTQRGYCRNINVLASVQIVGSKQVIINVKSAELTPLEEFSADIAVCLDSWVGGVKSVHSKIYLQWPDGSRCILNDIDACGLVDVEEKKEKVDDSEFQNGDFYPGQTLFGPMQCLNEAKWVQCTKEMKALRQKPNRCVRAVVEQVKVDSVGVHWQCRAYSKDGACLEKEQPKFLVQGEDLKKLKLLNVFEPCTLQVGDRNYYTFQKGDVLLMKDQWRRMQRDLMLAAENSPLRPKPNLRRLQSDNKGPHLWPVENSENVTTEASASRNAVLPMPLQNNHTAPVSQNSVPLVVVDGGVGVDGNSSDQYEDNSDETASQSDTASASSGCSTGSFGKKKKGPALMTKVLKKKKLRRARKRAPLLVVKPGDRLVVETLSTTSQADVVWQDGSVEHGIPSTQLYPIHHLDDQEFFPGDFVIESKEDSSMRVYGVVQSVDHAGRTARVKWFRTYTSTDEPQPKFLEENEVSVYDLKDHPDFQYRPGTVVIRVANFEGEDANCTGGQVLDNYPEGRVQVWWVDGHISMCWPQDLYKVGEYDSDEGELWDDGSSEASWETESEDCFVADVSCPEEDMDEVLKPKLAANIEKARIAMSRLEEIFTQNPSLQTTGVMRQLLEVYKDCRYLDKLMGTSFFHESHFQGLLERVRERGRANAAQRVADQVSRLFHSNQNDVAEGETTTKSKSGEGAKSEDSHHRPWISVGKFGADDNSLPSATAEGSDVLPTPSPDVNTSVGPITVDDSGVFSISAKDSAGSSSAGESFASGDFLLSENLASLERRVTTAAINVRNLEDNTSTVSMSTGGETIEQVANRDQAAEGNVGSGGGVGRSTMRVSESSGTLGVEEVNSSHVCVRLCSLIKAQLVRAHAEVTKRFGGRRVRFSEVEMIVDSPENGEDADDEGDDLDDEEKAKLMPKAAKTEKEGSKEVDKEISKPCNGNVSAKVEEPKEALKIALPTGTTAKRKVAEVASPTEEYAEKQGDSMEGFSIVETAPDSHKFKLTMFLPTDSKSFFKTVKKELKLLRNSLPSGIWVKGFEDRMDLYSVMIRGPEKTPYEDGLFFFDFQLSADYPKAPPVCHYISYCSDRLNPNLYEDGKVCVSLLGTWSGKGTEVWTSNSNLLQVIISIQGLILVSEPYFNEAGYEKQKGSQQGKENSRMYNEMVVLKQVQALTKIILNPPPVFKEEILEHFRLHAYKLMNRLETWLQISERYNNSHPLSPTTPTSFRELHGEAISSAINVQLPEFPLIPASKGFCLTLRKTLVSFRDVLASFGISEVTNGEEATKMHDQLKEQQQQVMQKNDERDCSKS